MRLGDASFNAQGRGRAVFVGLPLWSWALFSFSSIHMFAFPFILVGHGGCSFQAFYRLDVQNNSGETQ